MPKRPPTQSGTPKLSEAARHLVLPTGIVSSGWPEIRAQSRALGIEFEPWQEGLGLAAFGKRPDGTYAASVGGVAMSIPRQVGKTFLVGAIAFSMCLRQPGLKVIWTAHHSNTASETFESMRQMAERPKIAPYVDRVLTGGNQFRVIFRNRSRIEFGAREHGFGRGKSKVGLLILDEAQIMSEAALENMVPSMNRATNPLLFMMGTPPRPIDNGEMFRNKRARALKGDSEDTLYVEFSADAGANLDDDKQWRKANPSYPRHTPKTAMLRMRETFGAAGFRREALGIWDEEVSASSRLISVDEWAAISATQPPPDGVRSFGVAFSYDGERAALAGAVKHDAGVHLELIGTSSATGLDSVARWLIERKADAAQITLSGGAMAKVLHQLLRDGGVPERQIKTLATAEYFAACGMLHDSVKDKTVTVPKGDPVADPLEASVAVSDKKQRGSGWGWQATTPDGDETPMEAVSVALYGARTTKRRPGRKQVMW